MDYSKTYSEPAMGLKQHVRLGMISFANNGCDDSGGHIVWLVGKNEIPDHSIRSYINMQNLVNQCANHGEHINAEFLHINQFILGRTKEDFDEPGGRDFMKLKSNIVSYVKRDLESQSLASKDFRASLEHFVTYRNIFTHGKIRMLTTGPEGFVSNDCPPSSDGKHLLSILPGRIAEGKWYISYLINATQSVALELNKDLIDRYIRVYEEAIVFIDKFREVKNASVE
jgi:hypothetical protein